MLTILKYWELLIFREGVNELSEGFVKNLLGDKFFLQTLPVEKVYTLTP